MTADDQASTYGSAVPTLTASYTGFTNGDTSGSLTDPARCSTAATSASPAGPYAIICSGAVDPNYDITSVDGTLTIAKAALTVTADDQSSTYGSALPTLTAVVRRVHQRRHRRLADHPADLLDHGHRGLARPGSTPSPARGRSTRTTTSPTPRGP